MTAAAAALALVAYLVTSGNPLIPIAAADLPAEAIRFYQTDRQSADRSLSSAAADDSAASPHAASFDKRYQLSAAVRIWPGTQRRWVRRFLDRSIPAMAYDLVAPDGSRATVYVILGEVPGLPGLPGSHSLGTGRTYWSTVWQEPGRVNVLVVNSRDPNAYRHFLTAAGQIT